VQLPDSRLCKHRLPLALRIKFAQGWCFADSVSGLHAEIYRSPKTIAESLLGSASELAKKLTSISSR